MIKSSLVPCGPCCQDLKALTGHPPVLSASGARGALDIGWGGRGGAIIRPISAVPPKFMSVIRAHSSKLPVNRPFSMKRLFFSSCVVLIGQAPGGETRVFGPGPRQEALAPNKRPGASWAILSRWSPGRPQLRRRGEVLLRKTAHSLLRNTDSALAGARMSPMTGLQSVIAFLPFTAESGMVNMP